MALIIKEFDQYVLSYYTEISEPIVATIHCFLGTSYHGSITFLKAGESVSDSLSSNTIKLEYHEEHFSRVLDIIRNERPLYLRYFEEYQRGWLITSKEEVGEEES
ncbi:MAG: hypothetical protein AAGG75_14460 [Bacteroidota bacterium]